MNTAHLKLFSIRLLYSLIALSLCRLAFALYHLKVYKIFPLESLFRSFAHGLRFDASSLILLGVPFIFFSLLPLPFSWRKHTHYQKFLFALWLLLSIPCITLSLVDIEYFAITGRRMSLALLGVSNETGQQIAQFSYNYWPITLTTLFTPFVAWRLQRAQLKNLFNTYAATKKWHSYIIAIFIFALSIPTCVFFIRGGTQVKPLHPTHAFDAKGSNAQLAQLTLNQPFYIIHSRGSRHVKEFPSGLDPKEVARIIERGSHAKELSSPRIHRSNVVVFILESFAAEYVGHLNQGDGYTPFLDEIAQKGVSFETFYANGRTSIEAIPSILASVPSLAGEPFVSSVYQSNQVHGLAGALKNEGYKTAFFHGGQNGTMFFDVAANISGFEHYYGLNEYPNKADYDGQWGVWDHLFLKFMLQELNQFAVPFFASLFTVSSHQPYKIPNDFIEGSRQGPIEILGSIHYADRALRSFFEQARHQPWFENTLFVFTADHTQKNFRDSYRNNHGYYQVPLILYHPKIVSWDVDRQKTGQHVDIPHTVLDFLDLSSKNLLPFGHSMLDKKSEGWAFNRINDNEYALMQKPYCLILDQNNKSRFYNYVNDPYLSQELQEVASFAKMDRKARALLDFYTVGINHNNWYKWPK